MKSKIENYRCIVNSNYIFKKSLTYKKNVNNLFWVMIKTWSSFSPNFLLYSNFHIFGNMEHQRNWYSILSHPDWPVSRIWHADHSLLPENLFKLPFQNSIHSWFFSHPTVSSFPVFIFSLISYLVFQNLVHRSLLFSDHTHFLSDLIQQRDLIYHLYPNNSPMHVSRLDLTPEF